MKFSTTSTADSFRFTERPLVVSLAMAFTGFWFFSFFGTTDIVNWWIENLLVIIFATILVLSYRRFSFSDLSYCFIFVFLVLHVYGAKYAYADNPFGFWLQETLHTARNPYDRLVHTSFGLLMAYPMREFLIRKFRAGKRVGWIMPVELILSLSAAFELVEWAIADVFFPEHGQNYVGTQGDVWDAQKDIFMATSGAILVMLAGRVLQQWMAGTRKRVVRFAAQAADGNSVGHHN